MENRNSTSSEERKDLAVQNDPGVVLLKLNIPAPLGFLCFAIGIYYLSLSIVPALKSWDLISFYAIPEMNWVSELLSKTIKIPVSNFIAIIVVYMILWCTLRRPQFEGVG